MLLDDALQLSQDMVTARTQHPLYNRCVALRNLYKALITGEDGGVLLKRFVRREDDEAFDQRVALTVHITPAICAALMKPFNKVSRNNKVKKNYNFGTTARNATVEEMRQSFYGRKKSTNRGWDYWLKNRYPALAFVDPNAFVITEWDAPVDQAQIIKPRPYEVTSENAWSWNVVNEEILWVWVHIDIVFQQLIKEKGQRIAEARKAGQYNDVAGDQFTLYDEDWTLVYKQVDPDYLKSIGYKFQANESLWQDPKTKAWYLLCQYEPKLGFVPGFRCGWVKDNETDGETFVNGFHEAMPYLMKSVKTVSEMDLTMSLHVFPQKLQYVQKCPGVDRKRCDYGKLADGNICPSCKGSGFKVHTSAQDALFFPMPDLSSTTNAEMLDLEKMLVYKNPPIDLLKFQQEYIESLKQDCSKAVFGEGQHAKVTQKPTQAPQPATATEVNLNMQGTYDALLPYTEKSCDVWIDEINTFGRLAGTPEAFKSTITCVFPADFKMKSIDELLMDLAAINAAGAPSFLRDQINSDIAEVMYQGDEIAEKMYLIRHKFYPFNGQTSDEVAMNMASQYVSSFTKVLYANFEAIFIDIDLEDPGFWFKSYDYQWTVVEEKVNEYLAEIQQSLQPDLKIPPGITVAGDIEDAAQAAAAGENGGADSTGADAKAEPKPGDPGYVEPVV